MERRAHRWCAERPRPLKWEFATPAAAGCGYAEIRLGDQPPESWLAGVSGQ